MQNMPIGIFRGDDTDAFSYQTIVGTINTDLDLTGCKAVFRYLGFSMEFDPIPEDRKLTIVIPADETKKFPPGLGYASLRVYDSDGRLKTFSNRIMVFVATKTPMFGSDEFEVDFNVRASLEPLKFFVGPNPDDFDEYRGYLEKVIDRASAAKYGLAILLDAIDSDLGAKDGVAATPVAVKAAYAAIIDKLTDDYYTAEQTDEAIDRVAAYYITRNAAGDAFETKAQLDSTTVFYSGGKVRTPTRNDYCVVLADETHDNAEYRYIYAVADGQTTGSWQPQFPVEGVMTVDQTVTRNSQNPVSGGGVWSAIWGALSALPTGFTSLYDWCVAQLAGKEPLLQPLLFSGSTIKTVSATVKDGSLLKPIGMPTSAITVNGKALSSDVTLTGADIAVSGTDATKINAALAGKASKADATLTDAATWVCNPATAYNGQAYHVEWEDRGWIAAWFLYAGDGQTPVSTSYSADASATRIEFTVSSGSVIATRAASQGYQLGSDGQHILASEAEAEALRTGKLDKSGGTFGATTISLTDEGIVVSGTQSSNLTLLSSSYNFLTHRDGLGVRYFAAPSTSGTFALTADIPYSLGTKIISNNAVTLDDRAINAVAVSSSLASLTVNFPTATSGKARDFGLRLTVASGITTAPELALPQGVTCENADGEAPEIGADGAATILYFTETASGVFLVKGEVVTAIS